MDNEYGITAAEIEEGKTMGGIAYLGIVGFLIAFLTNKENRYVMYHAQQSLVLVICSLLVPIPVLGWITGIGVLVLAIMGLLNGLNGKIQPLPLVGQFAPKLGLLKLQEGAPHTDNGPGSPDTK